MKKSMIAIAVAAATAATPFVAQATGPEVSGFADIIYTLVDDTADTGTTNTAESKFSADGEVDFKSNLAEDVTVRIDLDVNLGGGDSGDIEQAFFALKANNQISVVGGVFNNPIGWEAEDAPDMYQTSHSINYHLLDSQTALRGNNIAGVAAVGSFDSFTVTAALLNDLQHTDEENSLAIAIGVAPTKDVALELGFVTQEQDGGCTYFNSLTDHGCSVGNVIDANATITLSNGITAAAEVLLASEIIDYSAMAMMNMPIPETDFSATVRGELVSIDGIDDETMALTFAGLYTHNDALGVVGELKYLDDGDDDYITAVLEFVASF